MATDKDVKGSALPVSELTISERVIIQHSLGLLQKSWARARDAEPAQSEIRGIREKQIADVKALITKLM